MTVVICIDNRGGMMFNGRRQSSDKKLRKCLIELSGDAKLIMDGYSAGQFEKEYRDRITVIDGALCPTRENDIYFIEKADPKEFTDKAGKIVLYRWNRDYPADKYFDIKTLNNGWKLSETTEFAGNSHEKITREVYIR